jgi:hypothetical protein
MFVIWSLGQKTALFRHFSTFFPRYAPSKRQKTDEK